VPLIFLNLSLIIIGMISDYFVPLLTLNKRQNFKTHDQGNIVTLWENNFFDIFISYYLEYCLFKVGNS
jgi:hypothetical protein